MAKSICIVATKKGGGVRTCNNNESSSKETLYERQYIRNRTNMHHVQLFGEPKKLHSGYQHQMKKA